MSRWSLVEDRTVRGQGSTGVPALVAVPGTSGQEDVLVRLAASAADVMVELAPWLLLGAAIAGLLHGLLPPRFVQRHLRGRGSVAKAVLFGVPLPLCSCGVIPAGIGLKKDGASNGSAIGFLMSTPQTGVDSILVTSSFLGWPLALFKVAVAAVTGWIGGTLTDLTSGQDEAVRAPGADLEAGSVPAADEAEWRRRRRPKAMWAHALDILQTIWRWLVLGIVVSVLIDVFVPAAFFERLAAFGSLGSGLAALVISLPLYVCATASVPIAAALVAGGMPAGAAIVFLIAGPATNVATMGAVYRTFGGRPLAVYLSTLITGSLAGGLLFDALLEGSAVSAVHEHGASWWAVAAAVVLAGTLAWFALQDLRGWLLRRRAQRTPAPTAEMRIDGMTCMGCVGKVERALGSMPGVTAVEVDLEPGRARVAGDVSIGELIHTVEELGFRAAS